MTTAPAPDGALCLAFVNTLTIHDRPPAADPLQPGYANLLAWSEGARAVSPEWATRLRRMARKNARAAAAVRQRAIALRAALSGVVRRLISGEAPDPDDLALLDREIVAAHAHRQLVGDDGSLAWRWVEAPALDGVLWPVVLAAEALLLSPDMRLVRACAGEGCERLFLDTTKNGSRRYCSATGCGTRERVRRFRARSAAS